MSFPSSVRVRDMRGATKLFVLTSIVIVLGGVILFAARAAQSRAVPSHPPAVSGDPLVAAWQASVQQEGLARANAHETAVEEVDAQVLHPWRTLWRTRTAAVRPLENAAMTDFSRAMEGPALTRNLISQRTWSPAPTVRGAAASEAVARYLKGFQAIEHVALEAHEATLQGDGKRLTLRLALDIRGLASDGARRHDRGFLNAVFVREADAWTAAAVSVDRAETLTARGATFTDATSASGLDAVPVHERLEAIRRGGYALVVQDYDNDGRPDVFVGGHGKSQMLRNTAQGFVDVTERVGLPASETLVKAAALVDIDNDGARDLVMSRFVDRPGNDVVVYRNQSNRFVRLKDSIHRQQRYNRAMPMTVADFNRDGLLDLYVGFPGARDFTYTDFSPQTLASSGLFYNVGGGRFDDVTLSKLIDTAGFDGGSAYPHSTIAADWNVAGKVDLVIIDDRRNATRVFRNDGAGGFTEKHSELGIQSDGWGMGVAVGDYDGDGLNDMYVSNLDLLAARRIAPLLPPDARLFSGNHLFRNTGNGKFEDVTEKAGLAWAGEAAGGCTWIDYDNDGHLDLYVVNGLWSGRGARDLSSLFVRNFVASKTFKAPASAARTRDDGGHDVPTPASNEAMRILRNKADAASPPIYTMAGGQRNCLFRNNGDGTFTEVGYLAGVDRVEDGYVACVADYNKDGRADLFLRNADPGTRSHTFPPVVLLENRSTNGNRSLEVSLRGDGRKSNRDAVGAVVEITVNGRRQVRSIMTVSGAAMGETTAFFGLGPEGVAEGMRVRWPSGRVQDFRGVAAGRVSLVEAGGLQRL